MREKEREREIQTEKKERARKGENKIEKRESMCRGRECKHYRGRERE